MIISKNGLKKTYNIKGKKDYSTITKPESLKNTSVMTTVRVIIKHY